MCQSDFKAIACNWGTAQESVCVQVGIGFAMLFILEKVVQILLSNHIAKKCKTNAIYIQH